MGRQAGAEANVVESLEPLRDGSVSVTAVGRSVDSVATYKLLSPVTLVGGSAIGDVLPLWALSCLHFL